MHEIPGIKPEAKVLWKGTDVKVGADVAVFSTAVVPIFIGEGVLPTDNENFSLASLRDLKTSTKSRLAQLGLEVDERVGKLVADLSLKRGIQIGPGSVFAAEAIVYNHSARPISLEKGTDLFRFFDAPKDKLEGEDLEDLVLDRDVQISGRRKKDWDWIHGNGYIKSSGEKTGIAVRIRSGNRLWIPPSDVPISAREIQEADDYRGLLSQYFVPVPITIRPILWIGETVDMSLREGVEAELDKAVAPNLAATGLLDRWGQQINARLIDGGKTNWPVRVEVLSPTVPDMIPNYVIFRFMRANSVPQAI